MHDRSNWIGDKRFGEYFYDAYFDTTFWRFHEWAIDIIDELDKEFPGAGYENAVSKSCINNTNLAGVLKKIIKKLLTKNKSCGIL
jgi:hypothetical protein